MVNVSQSGRYSVTLNGKSKFYAANGTELTESYYKQVENPDVIVKSGNKNVNLNGTLTLRINKVAKNLQKAEGENGFIGKAWNWAKNTGDFGDSSDKVRELLANEQKLLTQFNSNVQRRGQIFKQLTGADYTPENLQKFVKGEIKLPSEQALAGYKDGQDMAVDVVADIGAGLVSYGVTAACVAGGIAAAPFTAGASLGLVAVGFGIAAGTGAAVKTAIKYADAETGGRTYALKDARYDAATGAFSGALAPFSLGVGGVVGNGVKNQAIKVLGKTALKAETTQAVAKTVAFTTAMSVEGSIGGGVDNAFRTAINGGSASEVFEAGLTGVECGAILGPVIGWGGKALGKTYKVTKGVLKKADDVVPTVTVKPKAIPEYELDGFGQVHFKNGVEPVKTEVEIIGKLEDGQSIIKGADDNALAAKMKAFRAQLLAKQQASSQVASDVAETIPKGYVHDAKTGKPVKVDMNKVRTEIDKNRIDSNKVIGEVTIYDEFGNELGQVHYSLYEKNVLKFEGLHSNVEGCGLGTRLITELKNLAKDNGCNKLIATASMSTGAANRPLTNMPFYYKLGFKASNKDRHNQILDCINNNKPISFELNNMVDIELNI